jgi:hypothetical protein
MPAITRWSRSREWSGRGAARRSARSAGGSGQARERLLGLQRLRREQLHPRALLGAELAHAQLAVAGQAEEHPRRLVTQRGALVEQLQAARAHQVQQQRQRPARRRVDVEQQQLPAPADAGELGAVDRRERGVERLQRVDPGSEGGLDSLARQRLAEPPGHDLHLGQLRHG